MLIPLKVYVPTGRRPWVNVGIVALTVAVSLMAFADGSDLPELLSGLKVERTGDFFSFDYTVSLTTEKLPLPALAVTSTLLHAGLLHLVGNMLFLWIFGNAVNCKFGQAGYLGLYLLCALGSGMVHYAFDYSPFVGASGAINGILGAFLVFYPRNDVTVLWVIWLRPGIYTLSSGWIILFWFVWDVAMLALGTRTNVALWAHVGGLIFGFAAAMACLLVGWLRPEPDEETLLDVLKRSK